MGILESISQDPEARRYYGIKEPKKINVTADMTEYMRAYRARQRSGEMTINETRSYGPCSVCGRAMYTSHGDGLPADQRKCRPCRRADSAPKKPRVRKRADPRPCEDCGVDVICRGTALCDPCRETRRAATAERRKIASAEWRRRHPEYDVIKARRRRALKAGLPSEPYTLAEIAERDDHTCQLCHRPVDMTLSGLDDWGPTIDHRIPISRGGPDTPANVQLAHRTCNVIKGNQTRSPAVS